MTTMTEAERKSHIEAEASFKATVLNKLDYAADQRKDDKKAIHARMDRMETKHTDIYKDVFTLIGENAKQISTVVERVKGVKEDVADDVKGSISDLEDDVREVGKNAGTKWGAFSGIISSVTLKIVDKIFGGI